MRNQVAIRWARTPWLAVLLLVTFFARALVPAGFMPGPGGLMVCSGYAPVAAGPAAHQMPHDMSGMDMAGMDMSSMDMSGMAMSGDSGSLGHGGHGSDHEGMGICPFAAAATTMSAPHAVSAVTFAQLIPAAIEPPPQEFIPRGTIVPTRLPRGPPSLA